MNRRHFIRSMGGSLAGLLMIRNVWAQGKSSNKPNILYIFTDQQYADAMSCAGNKDLETPGMDSLAKSGTRFTRAYCTQPLCSPSRASMFTGRMPHEVGVIENGKAIDTEYRDQELGVLLSGAGYECVYGGKWHLASIGYRGAHGFKKICGFDDVKLADRCIEFLKQPHDKPFFMVASFDNPHNICEYSRNQPLPWGPVSEVPVEECPNLPKNYAISPYEPDVIRHLQKANPRIYRGVEFTPNDWRQYRHGYYRMVEKVDAEIGRILNVLEQTGLDQNTLVIFSSDHGDGLGAHQWNQKTLFYEEEARIPLILSFKGRTHPGLVDREHVISNGLDIYPTICDYAGVDLPGDLNGRSLRPIIEGQTPKEWREYVVSETFANEGNIKMHGRMVRTRKYKYIVYSWGRYREQLFDMENDPGEMVNLAVESRYETILQQHRDLLADWIEKTDDRFIRHYAHPEQLPRLPGQEY